MNMKRAFFSRLISTLLSVTMMISCCFLFAAPAASAESGQYSHGVSYVTNLYNDRNGLPTSEANVVVQTSDGYIWIGSYGGLIRYDGENFINYTEQGGFPSSSVRSLLEASDGTLWIGTNDKGVFTYDGTEFVQIENPHNLFLCSRSLVELSDGTIVVCGNEGIAFVKNGVLDAFLDTGIYGKTVYCAGVDSFGRLWLSMDDGLMIIKGRTIQGTLPGDFFFKDSGEYAYCVSSDREGNIYVGSNRSTLVKVRVKQEALSMSSYEITKYQLYIGTQNNITIAEDGTICVGGLTGASAISPNGFITSFGLSDYAEAVAYMIKDQAGCLWLASSNLGLVKCAQGRFYVPRSDDGKLEATAINTIVLTRGQYYLGYDEGLLIYDSQWNRVNSPDKAELLEMLSGHRVRHILLDNEGNVWMAALDVGVVCYNPVTNQTKVYAERDGLSGNQTRSLLLLSDGGIAVGGREGIDIIQNEKIVQHYGSEDGMENTIILSMLEMADGTLLAGTDGKGIYAFRDGVITHYGYDEGLTDGVILRMTEDEDGLFISAGSNLYYSNHGTFTLLNNYNKDSGSILDLFVRGDVLWLLQNSGVLRIDKKTLLEGGQAATVLYTFEQGLSGSLVANTWSSVFEDRLYVPTRNGISVFDFEAADEVLPEGVINYVWVDDQILFNPKTLTLPTTNQRVTVSFAALNYKMNADCRIAYQIDGFDNSEIKVEGKSSETVSYTNLPGGDYTFRFRVYSLIDSENAQEYTLPIHKEKKLSEQIWFQTVIEVLAVLLVALACFSISRAQLHKAHKSKEQYRSIVEDALKTFANTIDAKDPYTHGHSYHVAMYSRELAKRLGMTEEEQEQIYYKALLHDIGKIGVPDDVLKKPGRLTSEERQIIEQHVSTGASILEDFKALSGIAEGAKYHHERMDGNGYQYHLKGEEIPFEARIIAVADTYDAMSSDRCYRKALPADVIRAELVKISGTQLDARIAALMIQMIDEGQVPIRDASTGKFTL